MISVLNPVVKQKEESYLSRPLLCIEKLSLTQLL